MRFGPRAVLMNTIAVIGFSAALLFCPSCVMPPIRPPGGQGFLSGFKTVFLDPFRGVDPQRVSDISSDEIVLRHRAVPASAVAGKNVLTQEDCRTIALANNLDLQVARLDEITKQGVAYSNKTKLLPHVFFSGDLSERDNPSYAYSEVLGQEGRPPKSGSASTSDPGVTSYSTGHERSTWRYSLETRWSPTDAALAYYLSKSSMNDCLKGHYQKLRVAQKLISTVDAAYFRLLCIQKCMPMAESLCSARMNVARKVRKAFEKKIINVEEYNRAQQNAIRAKRILSKLRNEMGKQQNILASAMGFSPDSCPDGGFLVVGILTVPCFNVPLCEMELTAVRNRPEAVESGLSHLNSTYDLKRAIVKYFPKVSGFWRLTRDKDRFLYNKDWKDIGVSVYFDLTDWVTNLQESAAAGANASKTRREMGSVALGITSQVRLAALHYFDSLDELQSTEAAVSTMSEVVNVAEKRAAREDLDLLALEDAKANLFQNKIDFMRSLGEANASLAELQGSMGVNYKEPKPLK